MLRISKRIKNALPILILGIFPMLLSSCTTSVSTISIGVFDKWAKYNTLQSYITDSDSKALKWISQREISLRFTLKPVDNNGSDIYRFGTAWIYGKDSTNNDTYYLATNIHVASALNDLNSSQNRYIETDDGSGLIKNYSLTAVAFTFISDSNVSSLRKNSDGSMNYLWEANKSDTYISLWSTIGDNSKKPSIVYTATKDLLFGSNTMVDHFTNKNISNPAIDFALMKVDFSNVKDKINSNNTKVETFLSTYDSNPTKFISSADLDYNSSFYIAGFPEAETDWKQNTSVAWLGLNEIKVTPDNIFQSVDYQINNKFYDFDDPTSLIPSRNSIDYVKKENDETYVWYRNVARQLVIGDGSIGGGASGSMLVQETSSGNYQVAGIYWGAYDFTDKSGISYDYAAADLLISDGYTYSETNRGITINYNYPAYNVIDSIKSKITSLKTE